MTFDEAFARLMITEGGFVDHPADRGGATKYGISQRSYPDLDIPNLTREAAAQIYRRDFWDERFSKLEPLLAYKLFDLSVNMGTRTAMRLVQQALRNAGDREITIDGEFGPQTLQALRLTPLKVVLRKIRAAAAQHYVVLVLNDPTQRVFLDGWLDRAVM